MTPDWSLPPGQEKQSWPWESHQEANDTDLSRDWPRISIVTPSFNQGRFIERTIRSVLLQGYPNLEYIVIDGGSTDETRSILEKYDRSIDQWVSEPDRGQSHAINKGLLRSTGEVISWLNSDDYLTPNSLAVVAKEMTRSGVKALVGHSLRIHADGHPDRLFEGNYSGHYDLLRWWRGYHMHQPSIFWKREVMDAVGLLDESHHYMMDYDYWIRISQRFGFTNVDATLSVMQVHPDAKTSDGHLTYYTEVKKYCRRYWGPKSKPLYWRLLFDYHWFRARSHVKARWPASVTR